MQASDRRRFLKIAALNALYPPPAAEGSLGEPKIYGGSGTECQRVRNYCALCPWAAELVVR
jgi:hypothetical protein